MNDAESGALREEELRPAELAGQWYPSNAEGCEAFLQNVELASVPSPAVGAIVPHAGWVYSGAIAYRSLQALFQSRPNADLVILYGGHLGPRDPLRVFIEGGLSTPLGPIKIHANLAQEISMLIECEPENPDEYFDDNAVEVLLPMVKKLWPEAPALMLGVPPTPEATKTGAQVADLLRAHKIEEPVVIGSTDLTHYGPNYRYQPQGRGRVGLKWVKEKNDPEMLERITRYDMGRIVWTAQRSRNACSSGAVAAAMATGKKLGASKGVVVDYATSFDVRPSDPEPTSFVGYAGVLLA